MLALKQRISANFQSGCLYIIFIVAVWCILSKIDIALTIFASQQLQKKLCCLLFLSLLSMYVSEIWLTSQNKFKAQKIGLMSAHDLKLICVEQLNAHTQHQLQSPRLFYSFST